MNNKKIFFNVVIPTKNRSDTLMHTIKTLTGQNYKNLRIIILDNNSSDKTNTLIKSIKDKRIKYYRSKKNLSMKDNWERCFKCIHEGYTTIIGDDDGFLPNVFEKLNYILSTNKIKIFTWVQTDYFWKNFKEKSNFANIRIVDNREKILKRIKSETILNKILGMKILYTESPMIYNSFIKTSVLKKIKNKKKKFFSSGIPDVYSGFLMLLEFKYFYKLNIPITINGISSNSGGALISKKGKSRSDIIKNHKLAEIKLVPPIPSYYLGIIDPFLILSREYRKKCEKFLINYFYLRSRVLYEIRRENIKDYNIYVNDLDAFIDNLKLKYSFIQKIKIFLQIFSFEKYEIDKILTIKMLNKVKNIYVASLYIDKKYSQLTNRDSKIYFKKNKSTQIINFIKKTGFYNLAYTFRNFNKIFN